jgi:squalene-hopene/tetraprenyl-beta-curcumene cyclase
MPSLGLPLLLMTVAGATPTGPPAENQSAEPPIRKVVERSLGFLEKEGVAWMTKQDCASCHHVPLMVWALNEARNKGYRINEQALGEVTTWALAPENQAKVFPDLPLDKKRTETDYLGPLFMALAVGAAKDRDVATEKNRQRLLAHAVTQQEKDGSWDANRDGRPPVHASKDVQTSWLLLALSDLSATGAKDPWQGQREAAVAWLARNPPADSHQSHTMRLLVSQRLGKPVADLKPLLGFLLRRQNEDGGWRQTPTMESDAFATGLALAALSGQEVEGVEEATRRARTFLTRTQKPNGSWPMASRPAEPNGPGPARDLRPITYVGTAWAVIGLVRSSPGSGPDVK